MLGISWDAEVSWLMFYFNEGPHKYRNATVCVGVFHFIDKCQ